MKHSTKVQLHRRNKYCWYCGVKLALDSRDPQYKLLRATIDHKVPVSLGGKNEPGNIVSSCMKCNSQKGQLTVEEYRILLQRERGYLIRFHGELKL